MSISASEMRKKSRKIELSISGETFKSLIERQDKSIERAANRGETHCCFFISGSIWEDEWESEMKNYYRNLGYTFRPIGVIGGVRQIGNYICW